MAIKTTKAYTQRAGSATVCTTQTLVDESCASIPVTGPFGNKTVGPRTVIVLSDPLEWNEESTYEYLTLVLGNDGNSYISKKDVPAGTPLTDGDYWIKSSDYNAQLASIQADLNEAMKYIPDRMGVYSSTEESGYMEETVGESTKTVANPLWGSSSSSHLVNPLPIMQVLESYRTATNLKYGNYFTGTNVKTDLSGWEPAALHTDASGKMSIDCATLALLAIMGVTYSASTYASQTNQNIGFCNAINPFTEQVAEYMKYETQLINGGDTGANVFRLLASELAKLLHDAGQLTRVVPMNVTSQVSPGDVLFFDLSEDESKHWKGISHCAVVVDVFGGNVVVIDSSENRGGVNDCVNTHMLTTNDINHLKYYYTPPQYFYPSSYVNSYSTARQINADTPAEQTYATAGMYILTNRGTDTASVTLNKDYAGQTGNMQTQAITIPANYTFAMTVPAGCKVTVTSDKVLANIVNCTLNPLSQPYFSELS